MPQAKYTIKSNTINLQNTVLWIQIELAKAYTVRVVILSYYKQNILCFWPFFLHIYVVYVR